MVLQANDPHRDFLTDGYIAYTFSPRTAEMYLAYLFKLDPNLVRPFGHQSRPDAFFVSNPPVNPSPPSLLVQGRPTWLLDYVIRQAGSVVPQELWFPRGQGDWRRYVEQAQLHVPVFFVGVDGSLGVPVRYAAAGQMSLVGANEPAPLGDRTTTKIRIGVRTKYFSPSYPLPHLSLTVPMTVAGLSALGAAGTAERSDSREEPCHPREVR